MTTQKPPTPAWETHNIEVEQALLGAILMNNEAYHLALKYVAFGHFFEPIHQQIFEVGGQLIDGGKRCDPITLKSFMANDLILPNVTLSQYLARLAANATTVVNAMDYARIVRELADRRALAQIAHGLMPVDGANPVSLATEAITHLDTIVAASVDTGMQSFDMRQAMAAAVNATADAYRNDGAVIGLPTTLRDLDHRTSGFTREDLVVLAGRPGMGKSALALTVLRRQAEMGYRCLLISLEMSAVPMSHRMISDALFDENCENVPYIHLRNGRFHEKLFQNIRDVSERLAELPIRIDQQSGLTVSQIASRARQMKRKGGLDVLVVDHLDLVKPSGRYMGNKVYELGEITAALKALAKELQIVVILLCQLSRDVEKREIKRPMLADLRSSGSIEQDADTVIFLYRPAYYLQNAEPSAGTPEHVKWQDDMAAAHNKLEAIIAKQRMGPTGSVDLFCDIGNNAIRDLSNDHHYPGRH